MPSLVRRFVLPLRQIGAKLQWCAGLPPSRLRLRIPVKFRAHLVIEMTAAVLPSMTPVTLFLAACLLPVLTACNPTYNWRDVRPDNTSLSALLPCKPDQAQRSVPLGGQATELAMLGCDAGGATFAIALATPGDASQTAAVLTGWQTATLAHIKAGIGQVTPLTIPGAAVQPQAVLVRATGQRADGSAVQSQAAYFAQGRQVFQAVIYADRVRPEVAETFFSGLRFEAGSGRP